MARTYRTTAVRRAGNAFMKALLTLGIAPRRIVLLTVAGRRTDQPHSTPVRVLDHGGHRYLVAPYGEVGWVRNVRAAGTATLTRARREEAVQLSECAADESAPVLKEYARAERITRPYFDAKPSDPLERFTAEAEHHPVFRITGSSG